MKYTRYNLINQSCDKSSIQFRADSVQRDQNINTFLSDLDADPEAFVETTYSLPPKEDILQILKVPYVRRGFPNSCSECSAESILRYWQIKDWNQFVIHAFGYHTFEGDVSEGDLGLLFMFRNEEFKTVENQRVRFNVAIRQGKISDILDLLKQGIPVMARIFTNNNNNNKQQNKHTIVLFGVFQYKNERAFLFHDNDVAPARTFPFSEFKKAWSSYYIAISPK